MITVAIANDTLVALEALRRVIETDPNYELVWTASDGAEAVAQCQRHRPDLILMDLLMPGMDGIEATRQIMTQTPCAILLVTGSVAANTSKVFEAMGQGALDVVTTPAIGGLSENLAAAAQPLLAKMDTISAYLGKSVRLARHQSPGPSAPRLDLVVIGASTGGPKALATVLGALPPSYGAAIVVVQHLDDQFVPGFVDWLDGQSALPVSLAQPGDRPSQGKVLVGGGHSHLVMTPEHTLRYLEAHEDPFEPTALARSPMPLATAYCPSVDVFFKSVAQHWRSPGKAVLLTGMGSDGAVGMGLLQATGWQTIAQDEASCVVYGMPRAAIARGAASQACSLGEIAQAISTFS